MKLEPIRLTNYLTRLLENSILTKVKVENNKFDSRHSSKVIEYLFKSR